jgi:ABC-2 type transport system ATP-binding protein
MMNDNRENVVEIESITKTFGKYVAVDSLNLNVPRGRIYGFIGPNGSGKTTTLRMILNIIYPDTGLIRIFGGSAHGVSVDRIGYLPEERGLYKNMKLADLLRFFAGLKRKGNYKKEISDWLEKFDLEKWANKKVETLSKGMSQKVQFIASVIARPELLILDEPFTGLDPVNVDVIRNSILELQAEGTTVIFSTHDMEVAERMCDFIFMIFKGKKVLDGTLEAIQDNYGNDTIRIRTDDGLNVLNGLEGIEKVSNFGRMQELRISRGANPQKILADILSRTAVQSFEVAKPSLHDIFVRIAAPDEKEINRA